MKPVPPSPAASRARPSPRRRWPLIAAILLVGGIVAGLWPRAIPVEVAAVTRGPLVVTVDEEGMTRLKNRYVVSAPVAGQLRRIDWKAGAAVEAGKTVLAVLEGGSPDFLDTRALAQAEARVRAAAAARDGAAAQRERTAAAARTFRAELERARALREKQVLSAQEFDSVQMRADTAAQDARAAEFAVQVAEFELEQARAVLSRGTPGTKQSTEPLVITSPITGKILRVMQESARVVPAGLPLMEIGDPLDLEVRIEVLSRDGVAVAPGARVLLEQWGGDQPLEARVRLVEPAAFTKISALGVEEQRVYVIADFVDAPERRVRLGDSYRVEARIVTWENPSALRVPAGALFQQREQWRVFVVEAGRARLKNVKVGRGNGVSVEVLEGLAEGAQVVVYPGDKVRDGSRVAPLMVGER